MDQWQLFSRASGEVGRLRRCKSSVVTKWSGCHDCDDSERTHGGGVSLVSQCILRNPSMSKSELLKLQLQEFLSHWTLCNVSKSYFSKLSPEELERRRIRRERNKMAAAKCRNRRRELTETLQNVSAYHTNDRVLQIKNTF